MDRKIIESHPRVEYEFTMKEFKELLGIPDEDSVLVVSVSYKKVIVRMSWKDS